MRRARARTRRGAQDPELLGSVFAGSPARREHLSPPRPPTAERARAAILRLTESADCLQRLVRDSASRASGSNNTNGYISWPKLLRRVYALFADPTCRIQVDRRVVSYRRIAMIMPASRVVDAQGIFEPAPLRFGSADPPAAPPATAPAAEPPEPEEPPLEPPAPPPEDPAEPAEPTTLPPLAAPPLLKRLATESSSIWSSALGVSGLGFAPSMVTSGVLGVSGIETATAVAIRVR